MQFHINRRIEYTQPLPTCKEKGWYLLWSSLARQTVSKGGTCTMSTLYHRFRWKCTTDVPYDVNSVVSWPLFNNFLLGQFVGFALVKQSSRGQLVSGPIRCHLAGGRVRSDVECTRTKNTHKWSKTWNGTQIFIYKIPMGQPRRVL